MELKPSELTEPFEPLEPLTPLPNNQDGYRIEFTLVDAGEPGRNDEMAIRITSPAPWCWTCLVSS